MAKHKNKNIKHKDFSNKQVRKEFFKQVCYMHYAILIRTLWMEYGWRGKRIGDLISACLVLVEEVNRGSASVNEMTHQTKELTGIDIKKLFEEIVG